MMDWSKGHYREKEENEGKQRERERKGFGGFKKKQSVINEDEDEMCASASWSRISN